MDRALMGEDPRIGQVAGLLEDRPRRPERPLRPHLHDRDQALSRGEGKFLAKEPEPPLVGEQEGIGVIASPIVRQDLVACRRP